MQLIIRSLILESLDWKDTMFVYLSKPSKFVFNEWFEQIMNEYFTSFMKPCTCILLFDVTENPRNNQNKQSNK